MMKKLISLLLVLAIGVCLGYFFHDPIDAKLKDTFGAQRVEKGKAIVEDGGEKVYEKAESAMEAKKAEKEQE